MIDLEFIVFVSSFVLVMLSPIIVHILLRLCNKKPIVLKYLKNKQLEFEKRRQNKILQDTKVLNDIYDVLLELKGCDISSNVILKHTYSLTLKAHFQNVDTILFDTYNNPNCRVRNIIYYFINKVGSHLDNGGFYMPRTTIDDTILKAFKEALVYHTKMEYTEVELRNYD